MKPMVFLCLAVALFVNGVGAAAERSVSIEPVKAASGNSGPREWTLLVYLDGDNNLEPFALLDMQEMKRAANVERINLLVLVDRAKGYSTEWQDWQGTRLYQLVAGPAGGADWRMLADLGEQNMGDPAVLEQFLIRGISQHPARHFGLVMWDHGGGWSNFSNDDLAPGAAESQDHLSLAELRTAVQSALARTGVKQLDFIGFDMCLMAQLETMVAMEGLASVMVASQALEPGDGWPYQRVLPLFSGSGDSRAIASGIVDAFDGYYRSRDEAVHTLSAIDLTQVTPFVGALDALMRDIDAGSHWQSFIRSIYFAESYNDLADAQREAFALQSVDLMDVLNNFVSMYPEAARLQSWNLLTGAFQRLVIGARSSSQHRLSHGVAIYAPFQGPLMNRGYTETRLAGLSHWDDLLAQVHLAQNKAPSTVAINEIVTWNYVRNQEAPDVLQLGQDGFRYRITVENALRALVWRGSIDERGKITFFQKWVYAFHAESKYGREERRDRLTAVKGYGLPDGESAIFDRFDGTYLVVTDGKKTVPALIDQSDIGARENGYFLAKVIYDHPVDGRFQGNLRFNWMWKADNLAAAVPQKDGSFSYINITPKSDAKLHFITETVDSNGYPQENVSGSLTWGRGLSLTEALLPPGRYTNLFGIENLGGKMTFKRHDFTLTGRTDSFALSLNLEELTMQNLQGVWEVIDATPWFGQQKIVPMGGRVTYAPKQGHENLLEKKVIKGDEIISPEGMVTVLPTSGVAHMRDYVLDSDGEPDPAWRVRASLPVFDTVGGKYLMLSMDMSDGSVQVLLKTEGPEPVLAPMAIQQPGEYTPKGPGGQQPPDALTGAWLAADGTGLAFQGNSWASYNSGVISDQGLYQLSGNQLRTQSQVTGVAADYVFRIDGETLQVQDAFGKVYQFLRFKMQ